MKLAVFGGGYNQLELIHHIKLRDHFLLLIDPNENCVGRPYANQFSNYSNDHYNDLLKLLKNEEIDYLITTQMEAPLDLISRLSQDLDIPFMSPEVINRCINKYSSKKLLLEHGIKTPFFLNLKRNEIPKELPNEFVIKPLNLHSAIGVKKLSSKRELINYFNEFEFNDYILEEFISGNEYSVECFVENKNLKIIQITEKGLFSRTSPVEKSHIQPAQLAKNEIDSLNKYLSKIVNILELDNSPLHIEVISNNCNWYVIDIGPRGGGDCISSYLMEMSNGISLSAIYLSFLEQEDTSYLSKSTISKIEYLSLPENAIIEKVNDFNDLYFIPGVRLIHLSINEGDLVKRINSSKDRVGFILCFGNSHNEVKKRCSYVKKVLTERIFFKS